MDRSRTRADTFVRKNADLFGLTPQELERLSVKVGPGEKATTEKLRRLAALLVGDSAVQERIQADSALRSGWQDEEVRELLAPR